MTALVKIGIGAEEPRYIGYLKTTYIYILQVEIRNRWVLKYYIPNITTSNQQFFVCLCNIIITRCGRRRFFCRTDTARFSFAEVNSFHLCRLYIAVFSICIYFPRFWKCRVLVIKNNKKKNSCQVHFNKIYTSILCIYICLVLATIYPDNCSQAL